MTDLSSSEEKEKKGSLNPLYQTPPSEKSAVNPVFREAERDLREQEIERGYQISWIRARVNLLKTIASGGGDRRRPTYYIGFIIVAVLLLIAGYRAVQKYNQAVGLKQLKYKQVILTMHYTHDLAKIKEAHIIRDAVILPPKGYLFFHYYPRVSGYLYALHAKANHIQHVATTNFLKQRRRIFFEVQDLDLFFPNTDEEPNKVVRVKNKLLVSGENVITYGLSDLSEGHHMFCLILLSQKDSIEEVIREQRVDLGKHAFPYNCRQVLIDELGKEKPISLPYRIELDNNN